MLNTTLCYISRGSEYLMLHRVKKKNDINHDKWIGIGGKFETDESPDECLQRQMCIRDSAYLVALPRNSHLCKHQVRVGIHAPVHRRRL